MSVIKWAYVDIKVDAVDHLLVLHTKGIFIVCSSQPLLSIKCVLITFPHTGCYLNISRGIGGVIRSPNYPHKYLKNKSCEWDIHTSSPLSRILLQFPIFEMEGSRDGGKLPIMLSRASEAGSPTNRSGSDKTRGQGSFGPSTDGHVKHLTLGKLDNHQDKKNLKGMNHTFDSPFLLRQGEPGTSQYIYLGLNPYEHC